MERHGGEDEDEGEGDGNEDEDEVEGDGSQKQEDNNNNMNKNKTRRMEQEAAGPRNDLINEEGEDSADDDFDILELVRARTMGEDYYCSQEMTKVLEMEGRIRKQHSKPSLPYSKEIVTTPSGQNINSAVGGRSVAAPVPAADHDGMPRIQEENKESRNSDDFDILELVRARTTGVDYYYYQEKRKLKAERGAEAEAGAGRNRNTTQNHNKPRHTRSEPREGTTISPIERIVRPRHVVPRAPQEEEEEDNQQLSAEDLVTIMKSVEIRERAAAAALCEDNNNNNNINKNYQEEKTEVVDGDVHSINPSAMEEGVARLPIQQQQQQQAHDVHGYGCGGRKPGIPFVGVNGLRPGAYAGAPGASLHRCDDPRFSQVGVHPPPPSQLLSINGSSSKPSQVPPTNDSNNNELAHQTCSSLVQAHPITEESLSGEEDLSKATEVDPHVLEANTLHEKEDRRWKRIGLALVGISCLVLSIFLGFRYGHQSRYNNSDTSSPSLSPSTPPSAAPTQFLDPLLQILPNYTISNIYDPTTPQGAAYNLMTQPEYAEFLQDKETWRQQQIFALITFFYSFGGPFWPEDIQDHWLTPKDECLWFSSIFGSFFPDDGKYNPYSVFDMDPCNENGEFQALYLELLYPKGQTHPPSIPPEIALLTHLKLLALPFNGINGTLTDLLPSELYQMTSLTLLYLAGDDLSGSIPSQIGLMSNLEFLILQANLELTGTIPSQIALMTGLRSLQLSLANLTGTVPSELALLPNLERLWLDENDLTGTIPEELNDLVSDGYNFSLKLEGNNLSGTVSDTLCSLGIDLITFDCSGTLCGCDWCPCQEGSKNSTN